MMCDIIVAMPDATEDGKILFGKNSDRPAGECQPLSFYQAVKKISNNKIKCTYLTIPQSSRVLSTMGCKPYWSWGYETGMNEAGVVAKSSPLMMFWEKPPFSLNSRYLF